MRELLLVRHALAGSNEKGFASGTAPAEGLTPAGVVQARALASELAKEKLSLAVTSQFARTQQTLALALEGREVPVVVIPELNEIDFGSYDGGSLAEYREWAAAHAPDVPPPGGDESRAQAAARFADAIGLVAARSEERVLLVGHALMIRYVLDAAAGLAPTARIAPVPHAVTQRLDRYAVLCAATLLEAWSRVPVFRDPPNEG